MDHQQIIDRIDTSWADFRALIDSVPEAYALEPLTPGAWCIRDIVGHLAWWENRATDLILGLATDEPDGPSVEERNLIEYDRISSLSYQEALAELDHSHARITQTVRNTPSITLQQVEPDTWEHYEEHGADIRAWLESR